MNSARVGATQMRESFYYAYALNKDGVLTGKDLRAFENKSAYKQTATIGAMLETWDLVLFCLKIWDWLTGKNKRNFVLARNGFVYKGSGLFGFLTIVLTTIRSVERTSCSDPNPGSQCSYDGNRTYLQEWTNVGIYE